MSLTYVEHVSDGYYVTIQYCEANGCEEYLGVNYPSNKCPVHRENVQYRAKQ